MKKENGIKRTFGIIDRGLSRGEDILAVFACISILVLMLSISYSIIARFFFMNPPAWTVEVTEYILLFLTFAGAAWVLKKDGHVKVDILLNHLNIRTQKILNLITDCMGGILGLLLIWFGGKSTYYIFERKIMHVKYLPIPKFILLIGVPVAGCFLFYRFSKKIKSSLMYLRNLESEKESD